MTATNIDNHQPLAPGTPVEVQTRYQNRWSTGFEIAAISNDRYLIRRRSDGALLPITFPPDKIRHQR